MWRKDEVKPQGAPQAPAPTAVSFPQPSPSSSPATSSVAPSSSAASSSLPVSPRAAACIAQGIKIKGEITGKEDLFVDGTVEGKLEMGNGTVTVGPNGKVKADISAREIVVRGQVEGKLDGTEKVQLWSTGRVEGEVRTQRLAIEDGAVLRGQVEAGKEQPRGKEGRASSAFSGASDKSKCSSAAAASPSAVI
jgi:cytoskeletal protein CcmA (bactofilin family)